MNKRVSGKSEIDPRVVAVCRAMALSDGYPNPDSDSCIRQSPQTGMMGTQGCAERGPLWKRYWLKGQHFVAAFDALNAMAATSGQGEGAGAASGQTDEHCRHGNAWQAHCDGCGRIVGSLGMPGA